MLVLSTLTMAAQLALELPARAENPFGLDAHRMGAMNPVSEIVSNFVDGRPIWDSTEFQVMLVKINSGPNSGGYDVRTYDGDKDVKQVFGTYKDAMTEFNRVVAERRAAKLEKRAQMCLPR